VDRWPLRPHRVRPRRSQCALPEGALISPSSGSPVGPFVERSRKLSVPVSMMWALKVSRIDDGRHQPGIADHLTPLGERQVGGGSHRGLLLPLGEDLEHQLCPSSVELHVAEFVKAQQVERP